MKLPYHHHVADIEANDALIEIEIAAAKLREWMNRSYGQITRRTLARIEMVKREILCSKPN